MDIMRHPTLRKWSRDGIALPGNAMPDCAAAPETVIPPALREKPSLPRGAPHNCSHSCLPLATKADPPSVEAPPWLPRDTPQYVEPRDESSRTGGLPSSPLPSSPA